MKITQRKDLKTPFLQPDLLPISEFIKFCRECGVDTDEEELEYYDSQSYLVPAVRVQLGRVEFKKVYARFEGKKQWRTVAIEDIDKVNAEKVGKKTYYDRGALVRSAPLNNLLSGLHFGNDGWLDWYAERDMVHNPAEQGYKPWETFEGDRHFATKPDGFNEVSELMYSKLQVFPLKYIRDSFQITLHNDRLYRTPLEWKHAGKKITDWFMRMVPEDLVREQSEVWCKRIGLICDISELRLGKRRAEIEAYQQAKANFDEQTARLEAKDVTLNYEADNNLPNKATELLKKYNFSVVDVEDLRFKIMALGTFEYSFGQNPLRNYINVLDDDTLGKTEPVYGYANLVSWFIGLAGGEAMTVKQVLLNQRQATCVICGKAFSPVKRTDITCSPQCSKERSARYKREARKQGRYKY